MTNIVGTPWCPSFRVNYPNFTTQLRIARFHVISNLEYQPRLTKWKVHGMKMEKVKTFGTTFATQTPLSSTTKTMVTQPATPTTNTRTKKTFR
jgi:hypothetical protein